MQRLQTLSDAWLVLQVDFKLKFNGLWVLIMHHANFNNVEDDKILTWTSGNNLHATDDVLPVRNPKISHEINELLRLWADTSSKIQNDVKSFFSMGAYSASLRFLQFTLVARFTQKRVEVYKSGFTNALLPASEVYSKFNASDEFDLQRLNLFFAKLVVNNQSDRYSFVDSVDVSLCFNHEQTYARWNQSRWFAQSSLLGGWSEHFSFCNLRKRSPYLGLADLIWAN